MKPFGFLIKILFSTFPCLEKSSLCCHISLAAKIFHSQRAKSDFNISLRLQRPKLFCCIASHGVIADAKLESVGLSTLLYALLLSSLYISRTLTASPQKPAAGQCLGKMCQQDTVSRVGHINGRRRACEDLPATAGRISMWLLCQRCWSRGASAVPQSGSTANQIDNTNKQMFCQSQPF